MAATALVVRLAALLVADSTARLASPKLSPAVTLASSSKTVAASPLPKRDAHLVSVSRTIFALPVPNLNALRPSSTKTASALIPSRLHALLARNFPTAFALVKLRHLVLLATPSTMECALTGQSPSALLAPTLMALLVYLRGLRLVSLVSSMERSVKTSLLALQASTSMEESVFLRARPLVPLEPISPPTKPAESQLVATKTLTSMGRHASRLLTMRMTAFLEPTMTRDAAGLAPKKNPTVLLVESGTERLVLFSLFLNAALANTPMDDASSLKALVAAPVPSSMVRSVFLRIVRHALPEVFSVATSVSPASLPSVNLVRP
jgi:hypothetical protein